MPPAEPPAAAPGPGPDDAPAVEPATASTNRRTGRRLVIKWSWVVVVVAVTVTLLARQWDRISVQLSTMSPGLVALGVLLTVLAKLVLGENARLAAHAHGIPIGRETAVRLYNLSQLGKYLPGSVWQFVGRAAAYRDLGAGRGPIRDAIVTESLWVVGGAGLVGLVLSGAGVVPVVAESLGLRTLWWLALSGLAVAVVVLVLAVRRGASVVSWARRARPTPAACAAQAAIWVLLGTSFVALSRAGGVPVPPLYGIGLFAAAYAVGFLVLFVPAGLGVRDGILTLGLLPYAPAAQGLVVVLVARVAYVAVELLLVLVQEVVPRLTPRDRLDGSVGSARSRP